MQQRFVYPYDLTPDGDGWLVAFPDVPEALTGAASRADAAVQALDCLVVALGARIDHGDPIPSPGPTAGRPTAAPGPALAGKLALYTAMRADGVTVAALADRLGIAERDARRLLDPQRDTAPERLEAALDALGRRSPLAADGGG